MDRNKLRLNLPPQCQNQVKPSAARAVGVREIQPGNPVLQKLHPTYIHQEVVIQNSSFN